MAVFLTPCDLLAAILLQEWQLERTPDGWGWRLLSVPGNPNSKVLAIWYWRENKIQLKIAGVSEFPSNHRYLQFHQSVKSTINILEAFDVQIVATELRSN